RSLPVIYVTHHRNHWSARCEFFFTGLDDLLFFGLGDHVFKRGEADVKAKLLADLGGDVLIQSLVDGSHHPALQQELNYVLCLYFEPLGEVLERRTFDELERFEFGEDRLLFLLTIPAGASTVARRIDVLPFFVTAFAGASLSSTSPLARASGVLGDVRGAR